MTTDPAAIARGIAAEYGAALPHISIQRARRWTEGAIEASERVAKAIEQNAAVGEAAHYRELVGALAAVNMDAVSLHPETFEFGFRVQWPVIQRVMAILAKIEGDALAAATGTAKTAQQAECEASQSGPKGNAQ